MSEAVEDPPPTVDQGLESGNNDNLPRTDAQDDLLAEERPARRLSGMRWSDQESETLKALVLSFDTEDVDEIDWEVVASNRELEGKNAAACRHHWTTHLKPKGKRVSTNEVAQGAPQVDAHQPRLSSEEAGHNLLQGLKAGKAEQPPGSDAQEDMPEERGPMHQSLGMRWTDVEDDTLEASVRRYGAKKVDWEEVASNLQGKTADTCKTRWEEHLNDSKARKRWSDEEDEQLLKLVAKHGTQWPVIAKELPGREGKHCRHRWVNYLDPDLNKGDFTPEEDQMIIDHVTANPHSFAPVAHKLNRSANVVQNRWISTLSKRNRTPASKAADAPAGSGPSPGKLKSPTCAEQEVEHLQEEPEDNPLQEEPEDTLATDGPVRRRRRKSLNPTSGLSAEERRRREDPGPI